MFENISVSNLKKYVKLLHKTANVIILILDKRANILYVNNYIEYLTGYKREEIIGKNWMEIFIPSLYNDAIDNVFHDVIDNKNMHWGNENDIVCKDNSLKTILWNNSLSFNEEGEFEMVLAIGRDISKYKMAEKELKKTIKKLEYEQKKKDFLFSKVQDIVVETNGKEIVSANKRLLEFFGYETLEEFKEDNKCICHKFIAHEDYFSLDKVNEDENWIEMMLNLPTSKQIVVMMSAEYETHAFAVRFSSIAKKKYLIYFDDVTDLMMRTKHYEYKAHHDNLTGIFNREKFNTVYENLKIKNNASLIMFDIDHFKKVNDTYGHDIGDEVLKALCACVKHELRERDIFIRWGGEEFLILLPRLKESQLFSIAERIRKSVQALTVPKLPKITISLGATQIKNDKDKQTSLKRVDEALYKAKESGRNKTVEL